MTQLIRYSSVPLKTTVVERLPLTLHSHSHYCNDENTPRKKITFFYFINQLVKSTLIDRKCILKTYSTSIN